MKGKFKILMIFVLISISFITSCNKGDIVKDELIEAKIISVSIYGKSTLKVVAKARDESIFETVIWSHELANINFSENKYKYFSFRKTLYVKYADGVPFYKTEYDLMNVE